MSAEATEALKARLDEVMTKIAKTVETQEDEWKRHGEASEKTGKRLDGLDETFLELTAALAEATGALDETKTRLDTMEVEAKRFAPDRDEPRKTIGDMICDSDEFKRMIKNARGDCGKIEVPGYELKTSLSSAAASAGDLIDPFRKPDIFDLVPALGGTLMDIIPREKVSTGVVEFMQMTRFYPLWTTSTAQAAAGQADIAVTNINGFYPGQAIIIDPEASGTTETATIDAAGVTAATEGSATGTITCTANLSNTHASGVSVVSATFVYTPQLTLKPWGDMAFDLQQVNIMTLAHALPAARQILDDVPRLRSFINRKMASSHARSLEQQCLFGAGGTNEIDGIMAHADIQSVDWSSMPADTTKIDAVKRARTQSALTGYPPTDVCLYHTDMQDIEMAKGSDGHYLWATAPGRGGVTELWRMRTHEIFGLGATECLMGNFQEGVTLFDREQTTVRISEHHANFFMENKVAILLEERMALGLEIPASFINLTFDAAP